MIEIIPNWHPIFVHFAIGLLSISALFHLVAVINSKSTNYYQFESVANWNLWLGTLLSIVTITAGWFAYNTVEHDTPSHLAMTDHRNWGLGTTGIFIVLAAWSFMRTRKSLPINWVLAISLLIASTLLAVTGWKGGELVYRHGLGVMSLPKQSEHDHQAHDHGEGSHADDISSESMPAENDAAHEVGEHDHGHAEHDHDDISASDSPAEDQAESIPAATAENPNDGGHSHDHGDHTH